MTLGPFLFLAPFALLALIALPIIWWILRATPPMPQEAALPSLRLLDGIEPSEETPAHTPWWILLLRLAAAALAIIGLSGPIYAPGTQADTGEEGPLLIVIDDGWASASRWGELVDAARANLETVSRDTPIHLLTTAPRQRAFDPATRTERPDMAGRLTSLDPSPWAVDRADALARLDASGLSPQRIFWASSGMNGPATQTEPQDTAPLSGEAFATALADRAPLTIYAAPPRAAMAITAFEVDATGALATLVRAQTASEADVFVSALSRDGTGIATASAQFEAGATTTGARFTLPPAALSRADRFRIAGVEGAGALWLWDSAARRPRIGLVSDGEATQPLLSDLHYVRQALAPFALIEEGALETLILSAPDAIIMTDIGEIPEAALGRLTDWVNGGGALIRFAGPRLAAQGDALTPTPLRRASRALGGALAWDEPQSLAPFPSASPFSGLQPPADAKVRQQVLARPAPDLDEKTWARLEDGSPLVTAAPLGSGMIVLYHVTAGPDWSDLPYAGVFVEMLRRSIAAGQSQTIANADGLYAPQLVLDGFGRLVPPSDLAAPISAADFPQTPPSEINPPGLYQGPAGSLALNAARDYVPAPITDWPAGVTLLGDAEARAFPLAGFALGLALFLIAIDLLVALATTGRLSGARTARAAALLLALSVPLATPIGQQQTASAQVFSEEERANPALLMRFGYVLTGDSETDTRVEQGLSGLSRYLTERTSVAPAPPDAVDPETDPLELYPLIYLAVPETATPLSAQAIGKLNAYMRTGGALILDTRNGASVGGESDFSSLQSLLAGLDAPSLAPVPPDHVVTRSYYLIDGFQGRYSGRKLWIDASTITPGERRGDGVSSLFVGDADWVSAWASDDRGRALYGVDGGKLQREYALRFGINLAMHILTGNYKEDQVHLPTLLERLGQEDTRDNESEGRPEE
jgi:hypothetical protein